MEKSFYKKRLVNLLFLFAIMLVMAITIDVIPVCAKTTLEPDTQERYDLDGDGKKEQLIYQMSTKDGLLDWIDFSIQNTNQGFCFKNTYKADYYSASVSIYDINPKDKFKEVVIRIVAETTHSYYVYRYKNGKLNLLFKVEDIGMGSFWIAPKQKKGNKVLAYSCETCALGGVNNVVKNYKIKSQKIVECKPKSQIYKVGNGGQEYVAAKTISVFETSDGKNVLSNIKPGTKFKVTKLKYDNDGPAYALISIKDNKNLGWINVKYYYGCWSDDPLVEDVGIAG